MTDSSNYKLGKIAGYAMMIIGFLMVLANAVGYVLAWQVNLIPLMIIGLALVLVGKNLSVRR